jgi:hypothetical protein
MRNVLIHNYDDVSFAEVAGTIENNLPTLHATVLHLIDQDPVAPQSEDPSRVEIETISSEPPLDSDPDF